MKVIHTIKDFKGDIETLFNAFIDDLVSQEVVERGSSFPLIEIGPRENFSTVIHITMHIYNTIVLEVGISQNKSDIDVNYASRQETDFDSMPKELRKVQKKFMKQVGEAAAQQGRDAGFIPLIKKSITNAVKTLEAKSVVGEQTRFAINCPSCLHFFQNFHLPSQVLKGSIDFRQSITCPKCKDEFTLFVSKNPDTGRLDIQYS